MILSKEQIQKAINDYFTKKTVKRVWLFGSYARGEANEESDLDVLVDFEDDKKIGLRYLIWHEEIESIVNKKVQVVSNDAVSKHIRPFIDADKVLIYEK
jgi:predicted nucleotidyltransferase